MNTIILFWNPAISSYKFDDFQRELEEVSEFDDNMNWSVWEHEKAHAGDRFFMVRCGIGNTGICMSGYFSSAPYQGEDWSGKGREIYYMNLEPDVMIHSEYLPILTTKELSEAIPSFDWTGGHSGRLLDKQDAEILENLWENFIDKHKDIFTLRALRHVFEPSNYTESPEITCFLSITEEGKINAYSHHLNLNKSFDTLSQAKEYTFEVLSITYAKDKKLKFEFDHIDDEYQEIFSQVVEKLLSLPKPNIDFEVISQQYHQENILTICLYYLVKYHQETLQSLRDKNFPSEVILALIILIQTDGETEEQYLAKIMKNRIALNLKINMLENELEIKKLEKVTVDDVERLNKALRAYHKLDQSQLVMID